MQQEGTSSLFHRAITSEMAFQDNQGKTIIRNRHPELVSGSDSDILGVP